MHKWIHTVQTCVVQGSTVHDIMVKGKLWRPQKDQWLPELAEREG